MPESQKFTYHCHTDFSDGNNTAEEMVLRAKELGFTQIGISDHLMVHKNMWQSKSADYWRSRPHSNIFYADFKSITAKFKQHCDNLRRIGKQLGLKLYVGFEVDFFTYDGWFEEFQDFIAQLDYDYLISGNHMFFDESGENLFDINYFRQIDLPKTLADDYLRRHFQTIEKAVQSGLFKFLAHLDYARKLGNEFCAADSFINEKQAIINALAENKVGLEISTKGLRKVNDFYPCGWLLAAAAEQNVAMLVSDDAHRVEEMGFEFAKAEAELARYNIKNRLKF